MTTFRSFASASILLLGLSTGLFAEIPGLDSLPPPPTVWGKFAPADLAMKSFPSDSNASVVILCNYCDTRISKSYDVTLTRHLRIKLLNGKGFTWGTHSIDLYTGGEHGETIGPIKASTFTMDTSGTVAEHALDENDVFKEDLTNDIVRYSFTMPSLQPGCIIEIKYRIHSSLLLGLRDMTFQYSEPVVWSEYRLLHPSTLTFATVIHGYETVAINDRSYYSEGGTTYTFWRWAMKDLSAMRDEPFVTSLEDYTSKIDLQLKGYSVQRDLNSWEAFVKDWHKSQYIGGRVTTRGDVRDLAERLTEHIASPVEKMKALYAWVTAAIVWTGEESIYSLQQMDDVLESKKGNSADINYLLVSLLRSAGLRSDPIILSTRQHGRLQYFFPVVQQFNLGMARVQIDSTQYFLDATEPDRAFTLVPSKALGVRALVIQDGAAVEWLTVESRMLNKSMSVATVTLDESGALKGTIEGIFRDYANVDVRNGLRALKQDEFALSCFALDGARITVDSVDVIDKDSVEKPIKVKANISSEAYAQAGSELMYVNPHIVCRWKDNPFKSMTRKFPVDFNFPMEYSSITKLTLPDSFEVKEGLTDRVLNVDSRVLFRRQSVIDGNRVDVLSRFEIVNREIDPASYPRLQEFFSTMIQTESEQLVLQKKRMPAQAVQREAVPPADTPNHPAARKK